MENNTTTKQKLTSRSFKDFFFFEIRNLYYTEQKSLNIFFMMETAASSEEIKEVFRNNAFKTEEHIIQLGNLFDITHQEHRAEKCSAIIGMANDLALTITHTEKGSMTRDASLIMEAQKIEHYKMSMYKSLVQLSINAGMIDVSNLLSKMLIEDTATIELFDDLGKLFVNIEAVEEDETTE